MISYWIGISRRIPLEPFCSVLWFVHRNKISLMHLNALAPSSKEKKIFINIKKSHSKVTKHFHHWQNRKHHFNYQKYTKHPFTWHIYPPSLLTLLPEQICQPLCVTLYANMTHIWEWNGTGMADWEWDELEGSQSPARSGCPPCYLGHC